MDKHPFILSGIGDAETAEEAVKSLLKDVIQSLRRNWSGKDTEEVEEPNEPGSEY